MIIVITKILQEKIIIKVYLCTIIKIKKLLQEKKNEKILLYNL